MGMQFLGRFGDDQKVLEFALSYERVTSHLSTGGVGYEHETDKQKRQ